MVTDRHRAFARAVAALARQHEMDDLRFFFRDSVRSKAEPRCLEQIEAFWHSGRHGDNARITITTSAKEEITETPDGR